MKKSLLLTICALAFSTSAQAQFGNLNSGWSGEGSLSGSVTTGNTDTTDVGLGLKLEKEDGPWRHKFNALWDRGSVDGDATRRRIDLGYQIDRDINDRLYIYGNGDYYSDDFGAFQDGWFIGGGAGYHVLKDEPITWDIEGGAGFRSQQQQDFPTLDAAGNPTFDANGDPILTNGLTEDEFALRGFSDFDYQFNENVAFYNDTEVLWASSDTYIWNESGVTAKLTENISARASFRVDHHTNPPVGSVGTDTTTRFGIVYAIK